MSPDEYAAEKENASTRACKPEPYEEYVVECLRKYPDMSAAQLYDWISEKRDGIMPPFKERAFRYYVADIRQQYDIKKPNKIRQYEAVDDPPMGDQSQVDMGEIILETDTGRHRKVYCFGMVMSHSRDKFVWWQERPFTTDTFIACHIKAFTFFGGRTREIVYDQDKCLRRNDGSKWHGLLTKFSFTPILWNLLFQLTSACLLSLLSCSVDGIVVIYV